MRGTYVLIIELMSDASFTLKSLGPLVFQQGTWLYIGSAMGMGSTNLENRVARHFRLEKTIHWHIDYLLNSDSVIHSAIWAESSSSKECDLARNIGSLVDIHKGPKGFGASDCKEKCWTHLFQSKIKKDLEGKIEQIFKDLELNPRITRNGNLI